MHCFLMLLLMFGGVLHALETEPPAVVLPANWIFSGVVENEQGERYGYYFKWQQDAQKAEVESALFDAQHNKVLIQAEAKGEVHDTSNINWHVGDAFLRFNPINDTWIFGIKNAKKQGFNFKVDLLTASSTPSEVLKLSSYLSMQVRQTEHLNGQIQLAPEKDEFVTAKKAWFRTIWQTSTENASSFSQGVLCQFDDGGGFYALKTEANNILQGMLAGGFDAQGAPLLMSQFLDVNQEDQDGPWHIKAVTPKLDLTLMNALQNSSVTAGFVIPSKRGAFCLLSQDVFLKADA